MRVFRIKSMLLQIGTETTNYGYLDESFELEATAWSEVTGDWNQANQFV